MLSELQQFSRLNAKVAFVVGALSILNQQYLRRSMFYAEFIGQSVAERAVAQQVEVDQGKLGLELLFGA